MSSQPEKAVYPLDVQHDIVGEAEHLVRQRYYNESSVLAVYLGGSAVTGTLGVYRSTYRDNEEYRSGSDIDLLIVIADRPDWAALPKETQLHYGVRHIGRRTETRYRLIDTADGRDVLIKHIHPLEAIICSEHYFRGALAGRYPWGRIERPFVDDVASFEVLKETAALASLRKAYLRDGLDHAK